MPKYFFTRTRILKQLLGILSNQIEDYVKHGEILSFYEAQIFK
jgi:hypothetical protein